jgi:hypothetical protein
MEDRPFSRLLSTQDNIDAEKWQIHTHSASEIRIQDARIRTVEDRASGHCGLAICTLYHTSYLLTYGAEPFLRSCQLCSYSGTSRHFKEPDGSLPCSQEPSTGTYPAPDRSSPHPIYHTSLEHKCHCLLDSNTLWFDRYVQVFRRRVLHLCSGHRSPTCCSCTLKF